MRQTAKAWLARRFPNWAADTAMRYLPVARFLRSRVREGQCVLEVGGGDYGLAPYWPGTFVLTDLRLFRKPEGPPKVEASVLQLPFADESFDWVISIDMLEHIPPASRAFAIRELGRVARRCVVLGFPAGEAAARLDRALHERHASCRTAPAAFLAEHLENTLPDPQESEKALRGALARGNGNVQIDRRPNGPLWLTRWLLEVQFRGGFPWSVLNYGVFVVLSPLFSLLRPRRAYRTLIFAERRSSLD
jgi:SAM-dependent methyltransferase